MQAAKTMNTPIITVVVIGEVNKMGHLHFLSLKAGTVSVIYLAAPADMPSFSEDSI